MSFYDNDTVYLSQGKPTSASGKLCSELPDKRPRHWLR